MFSTTDTIVAIATPPGRGGIGVVRISGPEAGSVASAILDRALNRPRYATLSRVRTSGGAADGAGIASGRGAALDEVVATRFCGPASYTGEDVVEVSAHGSPYVLQEIVRLSVVAGARLAEPGEFTLRAFLNGRLDLVQAEAVADLVESVTPLQARAAFDQLEGTLTRTIEAIESDLFEIISELEASIDFPDEGYHFLDRNRANDRIAAICGRLRLLRQEGERGRVIREGRQVTILGAPNVGKSSLFNTLAGSERAIVTSLPGTTRDMLSEVTDIEGLRVTLVDTAGVRAASDEIEAEGVSRANQAAAVADLVLVVLDGSRLLSDEDEAVLAGVAGRPHVVAVNKMDVAGASVAKVTKAGGGLVEVSARTGVGLEELRQAIARALGAGEGREAPALTNIRHLNLVGTAEEALSRAVAGLSTEPAMPEEFVLSDLHEARAALEEVCGKRSTEEMLRHIFGRFCIGK